MRDDIVLMSNEAEKTWESYKIHNMDDSTSLLKDFYTDIAHNYALQVGYSPENSYRLSVFEILQGDIHNYSAEFILFNEVVVSELLYHYTVFLMVHYPEKLIGIYHSELDNIPLNLSFDMSNKTLYQLWQSNPTFVENIILTRVLSSYESHCKLLVDAQETLQRIPEDKSFYQDNNWDTSQFETMEKTVRENISRYDFILNIIEILVDNGAKPCSPLELQNYVHTYLAKLVKDNEEYLNPFIESNEKRKMLDGELRIQAYMEAQTGEDWIFPQ